ncbi:UNVERIFIED_CONTAM: hypothetical protein Sradi_4364400 [Sesamum radiatum]|uniref:Myb/SANT-like domain-containing protein n=1 Tax=Sesamum radiatum TaxID=300843 RepID=A0AAW2NPS9_SESRA
MARNFPQGNIKAEPHITSKLHVWKKQYSTLTSMMLKSGMGWDESRNMVTVEDDTAWEDYVKKDPTARGMRHKSWPLFNAWKEIFGKDWATGDRGADALKDANDIRQEEQEANQECYIPTAEWNPKIGKLKITDTNGDISKLLEMVSTFCESKNTRLGTLTRVLENEFGDPDQRAVVLQHVRELDVFSDNEHLRVANRLVKDPKELGLFLGLSRESRINWVKLMLDGLV